MDLTDSEKMLWMQLRDRQRRHVKFRRQHPLGPYFCDFYAPELKLDIECDGSSHDSESSHRADARRDAWMRKHRITVLRFSNDQIDQELPCVMQTIDETIQRLTVASHLTPNPSSAEKRGAGS